MSYKMLVLDLDGTVVNSQGRIGLRTLAAVRNAQAAGLRVVIATGRRLRNALPLVRELGVEGPTIFCNGALTVDTESWRALAVEPLKSDGSDVVRRWLNEGLSPLVCRQALIGADVLSHEPVHAGPAWLLEAAQRGEVATASSLAELAPEGLKLMTVAPARDVAAASLGLPGQTMVTACSDGTSLIEFWRRGVTKAAAVHRLARGAGIEAREIIAFGDNVNDVELLAYAGLGVAMGNAVPEALAAARMMTRTCDEDGVADVLETLLLSREVA